MNKEELRKELADKKALFVVGLAKDKDGAWFRFRIYYLKCDSDFPVIGEVFITGKELPPYWKEFRQLKNGRWVGGYFENKTKGTDRIYDIIAELGNWLYGNPRKFEYFLLNYE
jgi:hypothetical protein